MCVFFRKLNKKSHKNDMVALKRAVQDPLHNTLVNRFRSLSEGISVNDAVKK